MLSVNDFFDTGPKDLIDHYNKYRQYISGIDFHVLAAFGRL